MKRGQSLNITYETALMQTMTVQNNNFSLQILRNLARVNMFMVTFSTDGNPKNKPGCNEMFHPAGTEGRESDIEYFFTLGGTRLTQQTPPKQVTPEAKRPMPLSRLRKSTHLSVSDLDV